ncbi:MAG: NAD(P)/FAD-dependent oxidoreductase [Xanthobacteraceae bacterium]
MARALLVPVIGGGPAGMSCALWLANFGLRPLIVEREAALGGMGRLNPYRNDWLLGRPRETGRDNAAAFVQHIKESGIATRLQARKLRVRREAGDELTLELESAGVSEPERLACRSLVIATGTRFRGEQWLNQVEGARLLAASGRIHVGPSDAGNPAADLGRKVAIIGGGDNAFDVSRMLAERGVRVILVVRSPRPRARPALVDALRSHEASGLAAVMPDCTVLSLARAGERIRLNLSGGRRAEVDHVIVLFGYEPNSDAPWLVKLAPRKDPQGYLIVDENMQSSSPAVFGIGDVANPAHPCVATAIGAGTVAARQIARQLRV